MGSWGREAKTLVQEIGRRLIESTGDSRAGSFLVQRLAVAIQRVKRGECDGHLCTGKGNVELFTKEEILPVELKFLPYDVNSVMHFGNRDYSKNGHRTILFKDPKLQQNRVGLTETDLKKIEIVYGPECTLRDRKEKLELCQSYPGVARRKRQIDKDVLEDTMLLRMKRDVDEETVVTKSLRVNPDITPPPNQTDTITQTLKDLGIDEAVQEIVEQVYKVSAIALKNARAKYCNNTNEETPPTNLTKITDYRANNSDILGIIEVVTDFTKGMIDHALQNLTTFCENSGELHVYQRYSCSFGGRDPRCRDTYRSTKSGPVKARTQHRPIMSFSTGHNGGAKRIIQFERAGNAPEEEEDEPTTKSIRRKREAETTKADVTEEPTTKAPDDTVTVKEDEVKTTKKEKVTDKESQDDVTETAKGKTKTTTEKHAETKTSEADAKEEATKKTTPKAMTVKRKNNDKKEKAIPAKGKVIKTKERTRKDKKTVNKIPKNKDKTSKKEKSDKYKEKATKNSYFPLKRRVNLSERHINKAVKSKLKGNEHVARNSLKKKVNWSDSRTSKAFISKVSKNRGNTLLKSKAHDLRKRKVTTKENKIRPKVKTMVNKKDVLRLSGKIPAQQKNKLRRSRHLSDLSEESAEVLDNLDTIMANKIKRKKQRIQKNSRKSKHRHRGVRQHRKRDKKGNTDHMAIPIDAFEKDEYMNEGIALESEISRQQNSSEEIVKLIKDKIKFNLAPNKNGNERTKEHRNDEYEEKQEYRSLEYEDDRERPTRPSVTSSEELDRDLPRTVMLSKKNKDFYNERRWPRGELYYMIQVDTTYDLDDMRERLREVGDILEKKTCVKLIELEPGDEERFEDYILIDNSPDYVTGRVGGKQKFGSIELFRGGQHRQHAAMMVMAMLGFYFEVSRHDRDKYIRVHMRHVRPDKLHHFEMIRSDATLPLPYDYASATHPAWQFWRQVGRTGISTVATYKEQDPDGSIMKSLGQNEQLLSDIDIIKINSVYGIRCLTPRANSLPQNDSLEQNISEPLFKQVMLN